MKKTKLSIFERWLTLWVLLCICGGIGLGKTMPDAALKMDSLSVYEVFIRNPF